MGSNDKKSATLGMPHGTATHRLRKMILFDVLKRHNEAICFRCKEQIESVDEISIEHKEAWEGVSAELFWDLQNVTFSHVRCNRPDRPSGRNVKAITRPEGMNWCFRGKHFAPVENFYRDGNALLGLQNWCKQHRPPR